MVPDKNLHRSFRQNYYLFRRKVFKIFGGAFHVYNDYGDLLFYSKQKAFKLMEDFRVYADESEMQELLNIKTPQVLDWGATYHVQDSTTYEQVGALRRKWLKSMWRDEWTFLDNYGHEIGKLTESSLFGAFLSRLFNWIPQKYFIEAADGRRAAGVKRHFNPFVLKYSMTIEPDPTIDRRLLVAAGILLAAIERRQDE